MNKKKVAIAIAILALIVAIIVIIVSGIVKTNKSSGEEEINFKTLEDGTSINTSPMLLETKKIDGLEITGLELTEKNNITQLTGTITNTTNKEKEESIINLILVDKQGNEIATIGAYIKKLKAGESTTLKTSATLNYINAYDIKIKKN